MPALDGIKSRIKSVEATAKITSAMELVATAKLKKAKDVFAEVGNYTNIVFEKVNQLLVQIDPKTSKYLAQKEGSTLWIMITSDLGLCGGYNNNLFRSIKDQMGDNDKIIVVGNKGIGLTRHFTQVYKTYANTGGKVDYDIARSITNDVLGAINTKSLNIATVKLAYTHFVNNISFEPTVKQLLPAQKPEGVQVAKTDYTFEPDPVGVLDALIPLYVEALVYGYGAESHLSEQASRKMAMENATDNASELKKDLTIQYNRARQANITQEISEIIAGAEAI